MILPERSEWRCELLGMGEDLVFRPVKGHEPNWFWRWMQYLAFGNKWRKKPDEAGKVSEH